MTGSALRGVTIYPSLADSTVASSVLPFLAADILRDLGVRSIRLHDGNDDLRPALRSKGIDIREAVLAEALTTG
ncbi:hypothetical protein [Nocardia africana]